MDPLLAHMAPSSDYLVSRKLADTADAVTQLHFDLSLKLKFYDSFN